MIIPTGIPTRSAGAHPDGKVDHTLFEVEEQGPVFHQFNKCRKDIGRGWQDKGIFYNGDRNDLPEDKAQDNCQNSQPPVLMVLR